MSNLKLRGKDLNSIQYNSNRVKSLALGVMSKHFKYLPKEEKLALLFAIRKSPEDYLEDIILGVIAEAFVDTNQHKEQPEIIALKVAGDFQVFGRKHISSNAYQQMALAMRLPVATSGALMPDAHHGYGLPIGGVLATKNVVIPYGVGVDIGCRMSLSLFDVSEDYLKRHSYKFKMALKERTCFGAGGELNIRQEHPVLESNLFSSTTMLRQLRGKAVKQLGTSGSGNHFVEFGIVTLTDGNDLGLEPGEYLGLLSHSGSRGLGATIARYYTDLARKQCYLPKVAQHFAWLALDTDMGEEYWLSMNLAGDYAKACHDQIHHHISKYLGLDPVGLVENHHNFAWKSLNEKGEEIIVHRKGATPADEGELGIIPGSMATPGYVVRGRGNDESLKSASHGAGRKMSRKHARESMTNSALKKVLNKAGVTLIGGGVDESPAAYKDLELVMESQKELVSVIGTFMPKIVRMDKG